jgi:hypothetical protein
MLIERYAIAVVVHTHVGRMDHLQPLRDSIDASDIEHCEVSCQPPTTNNYLKMLHWLTLLNASAERLPYVLRLEDDVVVNRHILYNLCTWSALRDPDFGMGCLFAHEDNVQHFQRSQYGLAANSPRPRISYAQGQLFESRALRDATKAVWDVLRSEGHGWESIDKKWCRFDGTISLAIAKVRKHIYLHRPSLVDCSAVAAIDSLNEKRPKPTSGADQVCDTPQRVVEEIPHRALDFDLEWKRG